MTPRPVTRFEANLVTLLRFLLGRIPLDQARKPLVERHPVPPCLGPNAVHLVKDSLAKGVVLHLVRAGGWRRERFLCGGQPVAGRVWDRVPLAERELRFSGHVLEFLIWVTSEKPTDPKVKWDPSADELTPADELFFMLALDALRGEPGMAEAVRGKAAFARNPLCWLNRPADFAGLDITPPDFATCVIGVRAVFLECLQPTLACAWLRSERAKGQQGDWGRLRAEGEAEFAALAAFLAAAETAKRADLARFLLTTLTTMFGIGDPAASFWVGGLQGNGPTRLADRREAQRAALAVPRHAETLARWDRQARSVGYFDEEYAASQLWKQDYERANGLAVAAKARRLLDQLEPLRLTAAPTGGEGNGGGQ